jgi:hypothetical protein
MEKYRISTLLNLTRILFFTNAVVWFVFGAISLFRVTDGGDLLHRAIALMMLANAAVMFWLGVLIVSGRAQIFFLAILYVALNAVLSITDQFGWIDFLVLLLNLCLLGMLFVTRHRLNRAAGASSEES